MNKAVGASEVPEPSSDIRLHQSGDAASKTGWIVAHGLGVITLFEYGKDAGNFPQI